MTAITKAIHRIRNTKGSCYLTHKRGLKKALRSLGKALAAERTESDEIVVAATGPVIFRLVITTQVYENYGAHCWNGEGECPQYWKAKGGNEYQFPIGDANAVIALGSAGLTAMFHNHAGKLTRCDDYYDEYVIDWQVVPSNEETHEERELREMLEWGMIDNATYERQVAQLSAADIGTCQ